MRHDQPLHPAQPFDNRPIGVFDSGLGGLTAVRRMHEIMPKEKIIYFGDTGRVPYGTRSPETIVQYTRQDVAFLRSFDIKGIVVACGTVSSVALDIVAAETDVPMIGVVGPACRCALEATRSGRIGVIGTPGTIKSGSYERTLHRMREGLTVSAKACPLFVPLVENGRVHRGDIVIETVVAEYLAEMREAGVDTLILGCTHYPLLEDVIAAYMGPEVRLIDPGAAAAEYAAEVLARGEGPGETRYFVSDDPEAFGALANLFLQGELASRVERVEIAAQPVAGKEK